nr:BCCT family transporter [Acinetobacter baumannii]
GLKTIQTAIVLFGFPMVILLTIICVTLFKALHQEDISTINIVPKHPDVK